jgi:imidazoleglycerol-phosphate dehydratase
MDEVLVQVALDLSGRPYLALDLPVAVSEIGGFETELVGEFLRGLVNHAGITMHVRLLAPGNTHHVIECAFKAVARALAAAVAPNPRVTGVPSTKGSL